MNAPALAAEGLGFAVRSKVLLDGINLRIGGGEIVAVVGPNGAGKSTLVRALAGDLTPTAGRVLVDGRPVGGIPPRELALRRAVLPQHTVLEFAFTAREVVEMGQAPHGRVDPTVVASAMARTDTLDFAQRTYPSLSGGEQARVTLARVLAQQTPILLLDEPTAALDLQHQQLVMDVMRDLACDGALVVAVLHDLNLAAAADRIVVLDDGRIAADGPPWQVLDAGLLSEVFACPITVMPHPVTGGPLVLTTPKGAPVADPSLAGRTPV